MYNVQLDCQTNWENTINTLSEFPLWPKKAKLPQVKCEWIIHIWSKMVVVSMEYVRKWLARNCSFCTLLLNSAHQ